MARKTIAQLEAEKLDITLKYDTLVRTVDSATDRAYDLKPCSDGLNLIEEIRNAAELKPKMVNISMYVSLEVPAPIANKLINDEISLFDLDFGVEGDSFNVGDYDDVEYT